MSKKKTKKKERKSDVRKVITTTAPSRPFGLPLSNDPANPTAFELFLEEHKDSITRETVNGLEDFKREPGIHIDIHTLDSAKKFIPQLDDGIEDEPGIAVLRSRHGSCLIFEEALEIFVQYCPHDAEATVAGVLVERFLSYNDGYDFDHCMCYMKSTLRNFDNIITLVECDDWSEDYHYCLFTSIYLSGGVPYMRLIGACYYEKVIIGYSEEIQLKTEFSGLFETAWRKHGGEYRIIPCFASDDPLKNRTHFQLPTLYNCGFDDDFFEKYGKDFPSRTLLDAYDILYGTDDLKGIVDKFGDVDTNDAFEDFGKRFANDESETEYFTKIARECAMNNSRFTRARALVDRHHLENYGEEIFSEFRRNVLKHAQTLPSVERRVKIEKELNVFSKRSFSLPMQKSYRYKYWNIIKKYCATKSKPPSTFSYTGMSAGRFPADCLIP
ncbi:unnamed protein product [Auanema sp. JU1783]|nr:unnamed protein product [Auanema sp. JU1783]